MDWALGQGSKSYDPQSLGLEPGYAEYLRNRLRAAFLAGCDAGRAMTEPHADFHSRALFVAITRIVSAVQCIEADLDEEAMASARGFLRIAIEELEQIEKRLLSESESGG